MVTLDADDLAAIRLVIQEENENLLGEIKTCLADLDVARVVKSSNCGGCSSSDFDFDCGCNNNCGGCSSC